MSPSTPRDFLDQIDQVVAQIEAADIRVPEDSALIGIAKDLVPHVCHMLRAGIDTLTTIENFYDPQHHARNQGLESSPDSLSGIGLMIASEFAARDLNDITYFARTDLAERLDKLMTVASQPPSPIARVALASGCESSLRSLRRALISVESALCEYEDLPTPMRPWFDIEISLQIRRLYWNLQQETLSSEDSEAENVPETGTSNQRNALRPSAEQTLERRLRAALYRIVAFRELSIYPFLRIDDRVQMRQLLRRMLAWLNDSDRNLEDGRHLWEDLRTFAEILFQVSYRQELRDHDRELLDRTHHILFSQPGPPPPLPDSMRSKLEAVLGLDRELDQLILDSDQSSEAWRRPLNRLRLSLTPGVQPSGIGRGKLWG